MMSVKVTQEDWETGKPIAAKFPWNYFCRTPLLKDKALCIHDRISGKHFQESCSKIVSISSSSNKSMLSHLKAAHKLEPQQHNVVEQKQQGILKHVKILGYNEIRSYDSVISQLVCKDMISINRLVNSSALNFLFEKTFGKPLPKSVNTIRSIIMASYHEAKNILIKEINSNDDAPSIMFDEWISLSHKQYMSVICYKRSKKYFIGMVEVKDDATAEHLLKLLKDKLAEFRIRNFNTITVDGAKVNEKLSQLGQLKIQKCMNHGVHLAVVDTIYKNHAITTETKDEEDDPQMSEEEEDGVIDNSLQNDEAVQENKVVQEDEVVQDDEEIMSYQKLLNAAENRIPHFSSDEMSSAVTKARNISKFVLRSGKALRKLKLKIHLSPVIDCKTRWDSLVSMLSRFVLIKKNSI